MSTYIQKKRAFLLSIFFFVAVALPFSCSDDAVDPIVITASDFAVTIAENPTNGQVLGTIEASANRGALSFSMTPSEIFPDAMAVNATTGQLTVANAEYFDFETNATVTGAVKITNGKVIETVMVTITVTDVMEITIQMDNVEITMPENPVNGQVIGTAVATTNAESAIQYSVTDDNAPIAIDASTGEITVADATYFNYELRTYFMVNIKASTQGGAYNKMAYVAIILIDDATETVQKRLDDGETPKKIYDSNHDLLSELYAKNYAGGIIATFNPATGTGLILSPTLAGGPYTWSAGNAAANDLVLNGYDDWRLPTLAEVEAMCAVQATGWNILPLMFTAHWANDFCCSGGGAYNYYLSNSGCGNGYSPVSNTLDVKAVRTF
jgi:hypothetical protein